MTEPSLPRVAILLLNYNGLSLTEDCVRSLLAIDYPCARVLVIDNGSTRDESVALEAEFGDAIDVRRSEAALGFCAGNNLGMRMTLDQGFDYALLLNNDTTVEPDFLSRLVKRMETDRSIGAVGPKIVHFYDRAKLDSIGGKLNLWIARQSHLRKPYTEVRTDLPFIHGCAMMIRREAMEQVGMLDESFYAYWEEGDYCMRLRAEGWRIACDPSSVIYHKVSQTNRYLSNFYVYYMVRNGLLFMSKHGRWYQWPSFALCFVVTSIAKYGGYLLMTRPRDALVVLTAVSDFFRGRLGRKDFAPRSTGG